ncbi:oligopeptidase B [Dulcicalothrix desertica PCC 7102]|uniref:Oligopeptidase B n=1 Tax=Dulcicalothrix desertica PCC 7102 TaxID=232991 RepID=A0A3S1B3N0_9CYAN|nr:S9 family peptidase [Dulcicalothrix desertica]RUT04224.1 oligopeptidase B [Dulcicalothrix desertica PCC 7102]TWH51472.1 oligopeptidase B [Dulcicalothrix desertica PCC 7102]
MLKKDLKKLFAISLVCTVSLNACVTAGKTLEKQAQPETELLFSFNNKAATTQVKSIQPPLAPKKPHQEVRHGEIIRDDYFWLRDKENPEVLKYLKAENAYTESLTANLKPLQTQLYQEMLGRVQENRTSVAVQLGSYLYYTRYEKGKNYPIHCRKKNANAKEEMLLDQNQLAAREKYLNVSIFNVSNDGNLLAYAIDTKGDIRYNLVVKDLRSGKILSDSIQNITSLTWASDNTLFYVTADQMTNRPNTLWRLKLGSTPLHVIEEKDVEFSSEVSRTKDKKYILYTVRSKDTSETHYLDAAKPKFNLQTISKRAKGYEYSVEHRNGLWYKITNEGVNNQKAINNRIVTLPVGNSKGAEQEFLPHNQSVLINGIDLYKDFAVVSEKKLGVNRFLVYSFKTKKWREVNFADSVYTAFLGVDQEFTSEIINQPFDSNSFRYTYTSLILPTTVYEQNLATGTQKIIKRKQVPKYDASLYTTERVWAPVRNGVKVPLSIVYRKGVERNGQAPLLMYGYGAYGLEQKAEFDSNLISLLDRGVIYVIAHTRGGDELGKQWYEDGKLMNKKNTFNDFIDSAEYLISNRWTSKDRLLISGASAGGLLIGTVVNMRPDLFKAAHLGVPFVDVMNTMWDESLPLTTEEYLEWGNPHSLAAYDYMRAYSPYDNLAAKAYPAILLTTSINDSQVGYWEPTKYAAKLRTLKTDNNPLLLKINLEAGHQGASGRYEVLKDIAFEYAWMLSQVGF